MIAVDSNVLVRIAVGDDPAQLRRAGRAFVDAAEGDGVFVSLVVIAETAWVLGSTYGWDRTQIHESIHRLAGTDGVIIEDAAVLDAALQQYRDGRAGLADYIIAGKARSVGATLLTFDRQLVREGVAKAP